MRTLIRGATIVTMEPGTPDSLNADLLIEGAHIAAIAPALDVADAELVDGTGRIVIPGLINAHMHTWQTALRGVSADWTLLEYFRHMHAGLATQFTPDDIHVATLAGALNQIDTGTTTLVDWCHNNPTPAHTDAAVAALAASGIRAAFLHGSPKPDPKPGEPHFSEVAHPRAELERLLRGPFASRDQTLTLGMAILGPHYATTDVALQDFRLARELGLVVSMHQGGGPPKAPGGWELVEREGLLGPHVNIVHGNDLTDERMRRFVDAGVSFTSTPENEMAQGHGHPITGRLRALGAAPSLGVDIESVISGEMLTVGRVALAHQRALDNARIRAETGAIAGQTSIKTHEALSWITWQGACMLGMQDRIGSLSVGKQADLVLIDARALNLWPVHDPVATVMQASLANIEAVMIAGSWRKRDNRLLFDGLDGVLRQLRDSGERIGHGCKFEKPSASFFQRLPEQAADSYNDPRPKILLGTLTPSALAAPGEGGLRISSGSSGSSSGDASGASDPTRHAPPAARRQTDPRVLPLQRKPRWRLLTQRPLRSQRQRVLSSSIFSSKPAPADPAPDQASRPCRAAAEPSQGITLLSEFCGESSAVSQWRATARAYA